GLLRSLVEQPTTGGLEGFVLLDNGVETGEEGHDDETERKNTSEQHELVDKPTFVIQVHENERDEARLGGGDRKTDQKVARRRSGRPHIQWREQSQRHRDTGENAQGNAYLGVGPFCLAIVVNHFGHGCESVK